jgi:hypothetical protein
MSSSSTSSPSGVVVYKVNKDLYVPAISHPDGTMTGAGITTTDYDECVKQATLVAQTQNLPFLDLVSLSIPPHWMTDIYELLDIYLSKRYFQGGPLRDDMKTSHIKTYTWTIEIPTSFFSQDKSKRVSAGILKYIRMGCTPITDFIAKKEWIPKQTFKPMYVFESKKADVIDCTITLLYSLLPMTSNEEAINVTKQE